MHDHDIRALARQRRPLRGPQASAGQLTRRGGGLSMVSVIALREFPAPIPAEELELVDIRITGCSASG
jgi:hypothetical protein